MRILITFFSLSLSLLAKSECQYHLVELKLKVTTDNMSSIYYSSMSLCDFYSDSLQSKTYLIRSLNQGNLEDSITVFNDIIRYEYFMADTIHSKEKNTISSLINEVDLLVKDIDSVKVIEYKEVSVFDFISTELELADTLWLNTPPIRKIGFGAYLCTHQIFIHEKNLENNRVLNRLYNLQKEIDLKLESMHPEEGDEYDAKIWHLIQQLRNVKKMVVVSSCTD